MKKVFAALSAVLILAAFLAAVRSSGSKPAAHTETAGHGDVVQAESHLQDRVPSPARGNVLPYGKARTKPLVSDHPTAHDRPAATGAKKPDFRHPLADELRAAIGNGGEESTVAVSLIKPRMWDRRMDVLDAMRAEDDASIVMILGMILAENPEVMADPAVIAALRELTKHPVYAKRQAALAALSFATELSSDLVAEVTVISREDVHPAVRISAIATMSVWMEKQPSSIESMSRELLLTAQANSDNTVRGHAIQLIANQNVQLPDEVVEGMVHYLTWEKVPENRQLAALGVGGATGAMLPNALSALESAYIRETHQDTKRVILMQLVRASGVNASGLLQRLPASDVVLQNDIKDYRDLLAKGLTDSNEIWTQKSLLDAERGTEVGMNYSEHHNHSHN